MWYSSTYEIRIEMIYNQLKLSQEAFTAKDFTACCDLLYEVYLQWSQSRSMIPKEGLNVALSVVEHLVELPEIEVTDYIVGILAEERVLLERTSPLPSSLRSVMRLKDLVYDLRIVIHYMEDYFGRMDETATPAITVGIEALGKYSFYENIYESSVNASSQEA